MYLHADSVDSDQTDLSLRWAHRSFCYFIDTGSFIFYRCIEDTKSLNGRECPGEGGGKGRVLSYLGSTGTALFKK